MVTQLALQRSRFFGWETLVKSKIDRPDHVQQINYNCLGTGTHDFRVHVEASSPGLSFKADSKILSSIVC